MRYCAILLILFSISNNAWTQLKHIYQFKEENVVEYCWKNKDPKYNATQVPEKWKNESAVYLHFENLYETKATSNRGRGISYIAHRRIKILDQAALKDFSEIYYMEGPHGFYFIGYGYYDRQKDFLGVKVVKPDGREIIMGKDKIIKDEDGRKKVAVSNLEVGDILDYYLYTYDYTAGDYIYAVYDRFPIESSYPFQQLDYQLITDEHWNVKFISNDPNVSIEEKKVGHKLKDYQFSFQRSDIDPVSSMLWHYPYRSSPFVKLFVQFSRNFLEGKEKIGVKWRTEVLPADKIIDVYDDFYLKDNKAANNYRAFEKYLKKAGKINLSKMETLEEYYYYMRHFFINEHYVQDRFRGKNRSVSAKEFTGHIIYGLDKLNVSYDIIVVTPRAAGKISDVVDTRETDYLIRAHLEKPVYFYKPSAFTPFNYYPYLIEDTEGYVVHSPEQRKSKLRVKTSALPKSDCEANVMEYVSDVNFNGDDFMLLDVSTKATINGHHAINYKRPLVDWIDMIWKENERYGTKKWGDPIYAKNDSKVELEEFIASEEKRRKENFKAVAENHFDVEVEKLVDYECYTIGNNIGEDALKIRFDCQLKDMVKKVGPNYVLKAGELVGGQVTLDETDMERTYDIYMDFARGFDYTVNVTVPEGYDVKGLENFDLKVENETGFVESVAELNGNTLTIYFKKFYKNNYEPAANWALMKDFLIPAAQFTSKEILLKKK